MKFKSPLLVVKDIEKSKIFYREVLGLRVTTDFGANATLTGDIALQTHESWQELTGMSSDAIRFGSNDAELYFEEEEFDEFFRKLNAMNHIRYVHPPLEHRWGQRVVRFYDPDMHIIEVGENIKTVCRHFVDGGMTTEQTAIRMDVPISFVQSCIGD